MPKTIDTVVISGLVHHVQDEIKANGGWFEFELFQNHSIKSWTHAVENLKNGNQYDLMAHDWVITPERAKDLPFLHSHTDKGDVIVVAKNEKQNRDMFFFLTPFTTEVWLSLTMMLLIGTLVRYFVEYWEQRNNENQVKDTLRCAINLLISDFCYVNDLS